MARATDGGQRNLAWLRHSTGDRTPRLEDFVRLRARTTRVSGTPEQIADRLPDRHPAARCRGAFSSVGERR